MQKVIEIDGKQVGFKASALTPKLYRHRFGKDFIQDMSALRRAFAKAKKSEDENLTGVDLELFENIAYIMAFQYDRASVPESPDEWLDTFDTFSIYLIFPDLLELWGLNEQTTAIPKKG